MKIGITERGDGGLDQSWRDKLKLVDGVIIITKAPHLLLKSFIPDNSIIHCTITGLGGTKLEPNVRHYLEELDSWRKLKQILGPKRVVLRIDPIISWSPQAAFRVFEAAKPDKEDRVRISFLDLYPHVRERFEKINVEVPQIGLHADYQTRKWIWDEMGNPEVCSEPGLPCVGCVSKLDLEAMGLDWTGISNDLKGQRPKCNCLAIKKELLSNKHPCPHKCVYCYWRD